MTLSPCRVTEHSRAEPNTELPGRAGTSALVLSRGYVQYAYCASARFMNVVELHIHRARTVRKCYQRVRSVNAEFYDKMYVS